MIHFHHPAGRNAADVFYIFLRFSMASGMASGTRIPYSGIPSRFGDEMGMDLGFDPGYEMEDPGADHRDSVDPCDGFFLLWLCASLGDV